MKFAKENVAMTNVQAIYQYRTQITTLIDSIELLKLSKISPDLIEEVVAEAKWTLDRHQHDANVMSHV